MKEWQKRLTSITEQCIRQDKFALLDLYLKLSNNASDWIKDGLYNIQKGDSFIVPRENNTKLKFTFYEGTTELKSMSKDNDQSAILISKEDSAKKEYSRIYTIEDDMRISNKGLGSGIPNDWECFFAGLKKGDTFTFENKHTYCCLNNQNGKLLFTEVYSGNINNITIKTFENIQIQSLNLYRPDETQSFFDKNRLNYSGLIVPKLTENTFAQQYINKLQSKLKTGQTKRLKWGPINVLVKKKRVGKGLSWYVDGHKTDESNIKVMLSYFNNAPMETTFNRTKNDLITQFEDAQCLQTIKALNATSQYDNVYHLLKEYVNENKNTLTVDIKTFAPDKEGNYFAQKFSFMNDNGLVKVYGITFENNDFNGEIQTITEIAMNEFVEFCEKVNAHNKTIVFDDMKTQLMKHNALKELNDIQAKVIDNVATKQSLDELITEKSIKYDSQFDNIIKGCIDINQKGDSKNVTKYKNLFDVER